MPIAPTNLDAVETGAEVEVARVGGERSFRRRLMELGLLPGTPLRKRRVAPMGDPIEIDVRGARLSIRRAEAELILVRAPASAR